MLKKQNDKLLSAGIGVEPRKSPKYYHPLDLFGLFDILPQNKKAYWEGREMCLR